jgi:hypothetical protein
MLVISCAVNGAEQERMRWGTEPFFLAFFAMSAEAIMRRSFGLPAEGAPHGPTRAPAPGTVDHALSDHRQS